MNRLNELMVLNEAVDVIIAEANKENAKTETAITKMEEVLWQEMWDDIDKLYEYIPACLCSVWGEITAPYGYIDIYSINWGRTYNIKLYEKYVYMDFSGCHAEIKRNSYYKTKDNYGSEYVTGLLLNWNKTKKILEDKIAKRIATNIKNKTQNAKAKIEKDNELLEQLIKISI